MRYQKLIACMSSVTETFDRVGYNGNGRQALGRCISAFEAEKKDAGILEYQQLIGSAPNLTMALTDFDLKSLSADMQSKISSQLLGVMLAMDLLLRGHEQELS
jgi:hypothetical protein